MRSDKTASYSYAALIVMVAVLTLDRSAPAGDGVPKSSRVGNNVIFEFSGVLALPKFQFHPTKILQFSIPSLHIIIHLFHVSLRLIHV